MVRESLSFSGHLWDAPGGQIPWRGGDLAELAENDALPGPDGDGGETRNTIAEARQFVAMSEKPELLCVGRDAMLNRTRQAHSAEVFRSKGWRDPEAE